MRVQVVIGTRPEVIKMAPVVQRLQARSDALSVELGVVSQQTDILRDALTEWSLTPDWMVEPPSSPRPSVEFLAAVLPRIATHIGCGRPDLVLVHGDTNSTVAAALAAAYSGARVGHVEAGLRSGDMRDPFPEEMNRRLVDQLADVHYAPTVGARQNLLDEGVDPRYALVVGNTVVDALRSTVGDGSDANDRDPDHEVDRRMLLVTAHRRESFDSGIADVCRAIRTLVTRRQDLRVVYVLHPHPRAHEPAVAALEGVSNVQLLTPQPYAEFLRLMQRADLILTDSGGVQEEAPIFGTPVLVTRERTERHEGIRAGVARLVGCATSEIVREVGRLFDDPEAYAAMSRRCRPYGEPGAADRIVEHIVERFARTRAS